MIFAPGSSRSRRTVADARQRISVASWVMGLALALTLVWILPEITWTSPRILGGQIVLRISTNMLEAAIAIAVSLAVTDSVVQVHPSFASRSSQARMRACWPLYCLPAALALVMAMAQPLSAVPAASVVALLGGMAAYVLILFLLYESLDSEHPSAGLFAFLLHGLAYLTAFLLFLLLYQARGRLLVTVPLMAAAAMLLSIELLRTHAPRPRVLLTHALAIGLVAGQTALVLAFAPFAELTKGVLLIWSFFLLVNLCQNGLRQRIGPQLLAEYGVFSLLVVLLMALMEIEADWLVFV